MWTSYTRRRRGDTGPPSRVGLYLAVAGALATLALMVVASASAAPARPAVSAPPSIAKAHQIVVCSDLIEPPFIYRNSNNGKLAGSEFAIISSVAKQWGVKVATVQIGFNGLFSALSVGKCDTAIDEISDTAPREKVVSFVDYMSVGQTFLVKKGNPAHINSFMDLCGHYAGGVLASTDLAYLYTVSKRCTQAGKPAIHIQGFNQDPPGAEAVATGKIDAFEEDTPLVAKLVASHPSVLQMSAQKPVAKIPAGFAVRKSDTALQRALVAGINQLYRTGAIQKIFASYKEPGVALKGKDPVGVNLISRHAG